MATKANAGSLLKGRPLGSRSCLTAVIRVIPAVTGAAATGATSGLRIVVPCTVGENENGGRNRLTVTVGAGSFGSGHSAGDLATGLFESATQHIFTIVSCR